MGLTLRKDSPLTLHAFSDADWARDKDDYISTTAYIVYLEKKSHFDLRLQGNNVHKHDLPPRLNIGRWPMPQLKSCGLAAYFKSLVTKLMRHRWYIVTMRVLHMLVLIRNSIKKWNILVWIITLFGKMSNVENYGFLTSQLMTSSPMLSPSHSHVTPSTHCLAKLVFLHGCPFWGWVIRIDLLRSMLSITLGI